MRTLIFTLLIVAAFCNLVITFRAFNAIIKSIKSIQSRHPALWDAKGRPGGYFGALGFGTSPAAWRPRRKLFFEITFSKPDWIKADEELQRLWHRYILSYGSLWVVASLGAVFMFLYVPLG